MQKLLDTILLEDADYIYSYNKDGNTISKTNKSNREFVLNSLLDEQVILDGEEGQG